MGEPPLSGTCQFKTTLLVVELAVTAGAPGIPGSTGSKAANMRLPPLWRVIVAFVVNELGPPFTHAPTQPSAQPMTTRPSLSIVASKKSRRLRQVALVLLQIPPRWTGSFGVRLVVVQVAPPS